jgi:hypothetical protein
MCKKEVDFLIYCVEVYKSAKKLSGKDVIAIFDKYGVTDFITSCFEGLHIEGASAIVWQIDDFIKHHKQTSGNAKVMVA